jgi:hypothetical protein
MDNSIVVIEIIRSQILEIHNSIQEALLGNAVRKSPQKFKINETRRMLTRVSVTCADAPQQTFVIEELSRLLSLAESLRTSFDVLIRSNYPPPPSSLGDEE